MPANSLTITDNRTGKAYELPIANGAIRAMDLRQIRTDTDDFGLLSYDPAFTNTASTISRISEIDGDRGILRYRGYPIEELAERSSYLEVAYLVLHGELPTLAEMDRWMNDITQWQEMRADPEQKIARPRQLYLGSGKRAYVEMGKREEARGRRA